MIYKIHDYLNEMYTLAEELMALAKEKYKEAKLNNYTGHYIKIQGKYCYQKYPLPVVVIPQVGDIGVNLDKVWFEFFVSKEVVGEIDFEWLIDTYEIEVYGGEDCMVDFYQAGDSGISVQRKIEESRQKQIGIAIYIRDDIKGEEVIKHFEEVLEKLGRMEDVSSTR